MNKHASGGSPQRQAAYKRLIEEMRRRVLQPRKRLIVRGTALRLSVVGAVRRDRLRRIGAAAGTDGRGPAER